MVSTNNDETCVVHVRSEFEIPVSVNRPPQDESLLTIPPENDSGDHYDHFDTHKGPIKSFHPDFTFCHVEKGMITWFHMVETMLNRFLGPCLPLCQSFRIESR